MNHDFARQLRKTMTDAERWLWYELKAKRFDGKKFRRQVPIGNYIVDFACLASKIVVELDGGQHASQAERDETRTAWLNSQGYRVLRFWNYQVFEEPESVLETIWLALRDAPSPRPSPPRGEGARVGNATVCDVPLSSPLPRGERGPGGDDLTGASSSRKKTD